MKTNQSYLSILKNLCKNNINEKILIIYDIKGKKYTPVVDNIYQLRVELYKKIISDFEIITKEHKSILFQVPLSHSIDFLPFIVSSKELSAKNIKFVIFDLESISQISHKRESIEKCYQIFVEEVISVDKFIELSDSGKDVEVFLEKNEDKLAAKRIESDYKKMIGELMPIKPKLKMYLPSKEQSDLEDMHLEDFYRLYIKICSLDWQKMHIAQEELVKLIEKHDSIEIMGNDINIVASIKAMGARNSTVLTNYPGTEVFTAPLREYVNGFIHFHNEVYSRYTGDTIKGLRLGFVNGKVTTIEICNEHYSEDHKENLLTKLKKKLSEKDGNKYLGEIGFGTNFLVPIGLKHNLIGEKALGMHFALGKSYRYKEIDNGNHNTSIHLDIIRDMSDAKVYFLKENGEKALVINKTIFNPEYLPLLAKYQSEVSTP